MLTNIIQKILYNTNTIESNICLFGLPSCGNTTFLNQLKNDRLLSNVSSIANIKNNDDLKFETINYLNHIFNIYEFNSNKSFLNLNKSNINSYLNENLDQLIKNMTEFYYQTKSNQIFFLIDSTETNQEINQNFKLLIHSFLNNQKLFDSKVIFIVNKMDHENSNTSKNFVKQFELFKLNDKNIHWFIHSTNSINGDGVLEGIHWITEQYKS